MNGVLVLLIFLAVAAGLALVYWWAGGFSARGRADDRRIRDRRRQASSTARRYRRLGR
jgi:cytochrome c biogenesis protein CcdA